MSIYYYFSILAMLLIASCVIVCGFYLSARGEEVTHPDGTVTRHGNILKSWYFFWFKEHPLKKRYYYSGDAFTLLAVRMNSYLKPEAKIDPMKDLDFTEGIITVKPDFLSSVITIQKELDIKFHSNVDIRKIPSITSVVLMQPYKEEPDYVFPEWVRKMMAGCITCHASLWGSIVFWTFHLFCRSELLHAYFYAFTEPRLFDAAVILTWIGYTFSFAFVATYIYKRL